MSQLTHAEETFFQRAALKLRDNPGMTIEQSLRAVLDDDQRIFETLITMPDKQRAEFDRELSGQIYDAIRAKQRKERA